MAHLTHSRGRYGAVVVAGLAAAAVALGVPVAHGKLTSGVTNTINTVASNAYATCTAAGAGENTTDRAFFTLPFSEAAGTTAKDVSGSANPGTYSSTGITYAVANSAVCPRDKTTVVTLDGTAGAIYDNTKITDTNGPQSFSVEIWFKAPTTSKGGMLIGFGSSPTGTSSNYDRHIYIGADGKLIFGVYNGSTQTISTTTSVTDGNWHYAEASYSTTAGLALYLDNVKIGTLALPSATNYAQKFAGYWRIGFDSLSGWPDPPSAAANYYYGGNLAFASVYNYVLTTDQIQSHYLAGH